MAARRAEQAARECLVLIEEVEVDNWGVGGVPVPEMRRRLAAGKMVPPKKKR